MDVTAPLWPFRPNWRDAVTVSYAFRTDIFTSRDGTEQRRALRTTPRRSFSFTATAALEQQGRFDRFLDRYLNRSVRMPDVLRSTTTAEVMGASGRNVRLSSVPHWLAVGDTVALVDSLRIYRDAVVEAITGAVITFVDPPGEFPAGSLIHPIVIGMLGQALETSLVTTRISEAKILFNVEPTSEFGDFPAEIDEETPPRLRIRHNWERPLSVSRQWEIGQVDFERGKISTYRPVRFPSSIRTYNVFTIEPASLINFFCMMKGQRGTFVIAEDEDTMKVLGLPEGNTLRVEGDDVFHAYADDPVHQMIEVETTSGRYMRAVSAMVLNGTDTVLTLDEPVPVEPVQTIRWMVHGRFASDVLEVEYLTTLAARASVPIKTLPISAAAEAILRATVEGSIRNTATGDLREVLI